MKINHDDCTLKSFRARLGAFKILLFSKGLYTQSTRDEKKRDRTMTLPRLALPPLPKDDAKKAKQGAMYRPESQHMYKKRMNSSNPDELLKMEDLELTKQELK